MAQAEAATDGGSWTPEEANSWLLLAAAGTPTRAAQPNLPRVVDYRQDRLPIDKALLLAGDYEFAAARDLLQARRVTVDTEPAVLGMLVGRDSTITVDGVALPPRPAMCYYLLYKPRQVLTTCQHGPNDPADAPLVPEFVPPLPRVVPVGRLDLESEGLLLLTNDGSFQRLVIFPEFQLPKTYVVLVEGLRHPWRRQEVTADHVTRMCSRVPVMGKDESVGAEAVTVLDRDGEGRSLLQVVLAEGKRREIRR
eukprot:EG_transcript_25841